MSAGVRAKRVYEEAAPDDGHRVLVDRMWPRGLSRERAQVDEWARELAPSTELRTWFGHDPERFAAFRERYRRELESHAERLEELRRRAQREPVTILYAARDAEHNNGVVVADVLRGG
jgi:uncharacterized protein YeaO (DUF488 family)